MRHISDVTDIRAEEMIHETQKLSLSFKVFHKFKLSVARGFVGRDHIEVHAYPYLHLTREINREFIE